MTGTTCRPRCTGASIVLVVAGAIAAFAAPSQAAAAGPEVALAKKFAPVVRLVEQQDACGHGEPYEPTDVDVLFGSEDVVLRGPWDDVNVVKFRPTARDLSSGKVDYHLDFPGDPLDPGCSYEQWSKRLNVRARPTVYAHLAKQEGLPHKLALQFWFFYVFNDFNNNHEGDWEMIQLNFDAANAEEALSKRPTEVGYSQHEGGERAAWDDSKLERVAGTHPVVYPAAGSHANHYTSALFLGRNGSQGVGCDDTEGPSTEIRTDVALIPSTRSEYLSAYPWLGFRGRWGERQPSFYNGPTGPNMKSQWTRPISWANSSWRDQSFVVPAGGAGGSRATDFFCGAVERGSNALARAIRNPLPMLLGFGLFIALLLFAVSRTSWRGSAPLRLERRRSWGQMINAARRMYGSRLRVFMGIGLLFIPVGIVISIVQYLLFQLFTLAPLVDTTGESNVMVAGLALGLGLLFTLVALSFVQAATAQAMADIDLGRQVRALGAYRKALHKFPPLLGSVLIAFVVVVALELTFVGIPLAVWLLVRWSLLGQVVQLEGPGVVGALRRSGQLVHRHWWRVASITVGLAGLALIAGPVLGVLLLLVTDAAFNVVNLIAGLVYVVAMPFVAVATTYLYHDVNVRSVFEARESSAGQELPAEI